MKPIFVPYDDNNIEHVLAGQTNNAWSEIDSIEYEDYVLEIEKRILNFPLLKISPVKFPY